jgi:3-oxoacyl-[acyl-carrier-protein] synthase III
MASSVMTGMTLRGVVACLPEREVSNERDYPWFEPTEIRKVTSMVGVKSHRAVDEATCTSDLCQAAAARLLAEIGWKRESVDGLIVTSQTFDYVMPPTSCILQDRLGLRESCASFDVALGCSAYVYGLWLANSLLVSGACKRILLLAGDTPSKFVNPRDRATALLFGDAGTATALEAGGMTAKPAHYIMGTDGKGAKDLIVEGGGFRNRFPQEPEKYCVSMDGGHIFDFTRSRVPALIDEMLTFADRPASSYDLFLFHQANEYLIKFIASKSGIPLSKVPLQIRQFGNTAAASIPLTLAVSGPPSGDGESVDAMFLGFGVGLSWGAASLTILRSAFFSHFTLTTQ